MKTRGLFTIVELLIVIAVIAILLSLLQPALRKAIENANQVVCMNSHKQINHAFQMFTDDHQGYLPTTAPNPNPKHEWENNFFGGTHLPNPYEWRTLQASLYRGIEGTIWGYLNMSQHVKLFRCPSLEDMPIKPRNLGDMQPFIQAGEFFSNRYFDYAGLQFFSGAKINNVPTSSSIYIPTSNRHKTIADNEISAEMESVPTPITVEENPWANINMYYSEVSHGSSDQMGFWHSQMTSVYSAIDGSVQRVQFYVRGTSPWDWRIVHPRRGIVPLDSAFTHGQWNN